jgi:hypothetical protein
LARQKASKVDTLCPPQLLVPLIDGTLEVPALDTFEVIGMTPRDNAIFSTWAEAEEHANKCFGSIVYSKGKAFNLTRNATRQLCETLNIPVRYLDYLRSPSEDGSVTIPNDLARHTLAELLAHAGKSGQKLLIRQLDGRVRAVLSSRYRVLDNQDLFFCAAETFAQVGAELHSARLGEDKFELFAFAPGISGSVRTDRTFDPGDGWASRWHGNDGDVHNAAVRVSNSETGLGGMNVRPAILRKICQNYNIWGRTISQIHLGRNRGEVGLIYGEDTLASESTTIWLKVRDAIRTTFDPVKFKTYIETLNEATQVVIPEAKIEKAVEVVVGEYEISDERKLEILRNLLQSGDRTQYGITQAVTAAAHKLDAAGLVEEASALEDAGGDLVQLPGSKFLSLVGA